MLHKIDNDENVDADEQLSMKIKIEKIQQLHTYITSGRNNNRNTKNMKYTGNDASTALFSEQVHTVIELFEQWNDCERVVTLYALLKRIPFSCIKFIQHAIETNLTQSYNVEQTQILETNANSSVFLTNLSETYKNFKTTPVSVVPIVSGGTGSISTELNKDSIFYESDRNIQHRNIHNQHLHQQQRSCSTHQLHTTIQSYDKKEDILNDILTYMPLLKPGNDEAKAAILDIIPIAVDDVIRGYVNTSLVQQIFSFLLIHPAFTTDDRRSLNKFLRHLENHIISKEAKFLIYPNGASPTNEQSIGHTGSTSAITHSNSSSSNWQAIAPPQSKSNETISWDSSHHLTTQNFVDDTSIASDYNNHHHHNNHQASQPQQQQQQQQPHLHHNNNRNRVGSIIDFQSTAPGSTTSLSQLYGNNGIGGNGVGIGGNGVGSGGVTGTSGSDTIETGTDDHHISFSKNGTEILDFDCEDTDKSNTQICFDTLANLKEFLSVPGVMDNMALKTRRSNSLTTTGSLQTACTSSAQNLANIAQKPRSFSLSMVSPRSSLTSSGSDTRLDDFKPKYTKFSPHNIGMGNIGQWLKSLRLHKYVWLFSNITYDQMMDISEEYLHTLNVTKGARHKLVLCIQKLKERHGLLCQMEKDLLASKMTINAALDELTNIVLTPIKPVDNFNKQDVGGQFLRVLNLVSTMITTKHIVAQDEEMVNSLMWILEKAVHNEAFVAHTNQLKEHRFKVSRIKVQFPPKGHFGKTNPTTGNISRTRSFCNFLGPLDIHIQNQSMKSHSTSINSSIHQSSCPLSPASSLSSLPIHLPAFRDNSHMTAILNETTNNLATSTKSLPSPIVRPSKQQNQQHKTSSTPNGTDQSLYHHESIQFGSISNVFLATPDLFPCRTEAVLSSQRSSSLNLGLNELLSSNSPIFSTTTSEPNLCPSSSISGSNINSINYAQVTANNIGMINIPQWLKSLRLHKYNWIFTNITYETMLTISDDYLLRLNVTKGARDKLLMCIGKLKERFGMLCQMEDDIRMHRVSLGNVLDELLKIVVSPMKPIQVNGKEDIGRQLMNIFHLVCMMLSSKNDSEIGQKFVRVLDKAVTSEAFVAHTSQLINMKIRFT